MLAEVGKEFFMAAKLGIGRFTRRELRIWKVP